MNEFAALAVSFMATEFSSKVTIFDNGGIEPLVRLLSSSDPDVQKNSIEALAQMALVGRSIATSQDNWNEPHYNVQTVIFPPPVFSIVK